jgi:hypothetical protein
MDQIMINSHIRDGQIFQCRKDRVFFGFLIIE